MHQSREAGKIYPAPQQKDNQSVAYVGGRGSIRKNQMCSGSVGTSSKGAEKNCSASSSTIGLRVAKSPASVTSTAWEFDLGIGE